MIQMKVMQNELVIFMKMSSKMTATPEMDTNSVILNRTPCMLLHVLSYCNKYM